MTLSHTQAQRHVMNVIIYLFSHFQMTDSCKDGKLFPIYPVKVTKPKLLLHMLIVNFPVNGF